MQLHSGVPLSELWRTAELGSVAVCHFSGHVKSWDKEPDEEQRRPTSRDVTEGVEAKGGRLGAKSQVAGVKVV